MIRSTILASLIGLCIYPSQAAVPPIIKDPPTGTETTVGAAGGGPRTSISHGRPRSNRWAPHSGVNTAHIQAANQAAVQEPGRDTFVGAVQVYPWTEGGLYRLYTAPEQVSDILLESGESLISVAAGDTARWIIGDTSSGSGSQRRTHILVKPSAAGLATNLLIATDRRAYHVELRSNPKIAMASISWTYPEDALLALRATAAAEASVTPDVAVEELNFDYRIEGDRPAWRPLRAFDDGHQVFIEFPPSLSDGEAPPLFVTSAGGRTELVNYRLRGRYYVVDRLFSAAELRLGERRQQVVRIVRENPVPVRPGKSS